MCGLSPRVGGACLMIPSASYNWETPSLFKNSCLEGFFGACGKKKKKKGRHLFSLSGEQRAEKQVWILIFATFTHDLTVGTDDEH